MIVFLKNEDIEDSCAHLLLVICCCRFEQGSGSPGEERCMNPSVTEGKSASGSVVASSANTRLSGSWLIVARVVWLALVIPSVGLFVVSLIVTYQQMQTVCVDPATCNLSGALPPQVQHSLSAIGLSVSEFAILVTIFFVITAVVWYVVGFLIFWRRSDDWLALLAAFFLVLFSITSSGNTANAWPLPCGGPGNDAAGACFAVVASP